MKRHAPATARNSGPIADVLATELADVGNVLEIASGTGEHVVFMARRFPQLHWQPSDSDEEAIPSIRAWVAESGLANIADPLVLDAARDNWPERTFDAVFCANMIHISPWSSAVGLFAGAGSCLVPGGKLIVYGPFLEAGVETAASNLAFDESLRQRDPRWGIRSAEKCDALAVSASLLRTARYAMPANNLILIWTKGA